MNIITPLLPLCQASQYLAYKTGAQSHVYKYLVKLRSIDRHPSTAIFRGFMVQLDIEL